MFERMGVEFEENKIKMKSNLKKSTVKLFSCEVDNALETLGECDVMLKHDQFQCISPVIVAVNLANDCLIGMNALVLWPTMRDAIEVLLKARQHNSNDDRKFESDSKATRLNNICLTRILADFNIDRFKSKDQLKAIEYSTKSKVDSVVNEVATTEDCPTSNVEETLEDKEEESESAPIVEEQEFKENYLPEKHLQEIAVNFIVAGEVEKEQDIEKLDQKFSNVEGMIKGIFPQLIAGDKGEVGLALNCVHEINLKPVVF